MAETFVQRTTTDLVFEQLHEDIVTLKLLPGAKISEADIASRMGVSRQPVRDAFNRLGHLDLLSIRPQRATRVRGFSREKIENARFVRLAVEIEVVRRAAQLWDATAEAKLEESLQEQRTAIAAGDVAAFHALDYHFHKLICDLAGQSLAFDTVVNCKQQVDRLCVLSLNQPAEVSAVMQDHEDLADALSNRPVEVVESVLRRHLCRLDDVIANIQDSHSDYFE